MNTHNNRTLFFQILEHSLQDNTFAKATLSKSVSAYRWKRLVVSAFINSRGQRELSFEYSDGRQVERKNLSSSESYETLKLLLTECFRSAYVRTASEELSFERTDKETFRLKRKNLENEQLTVPHHNREKHHLIPADSPFLIELGISSKEGLVRRDRYDKFRQIQKFIEIIDSLIPSECLTSPDGLRAIDFGSGKHYLTFALHHFLTSHSSAHSIVGVEQREELVASGKTVADKIGCANICFKASTIEASSFDYADAVVALHACDTATDDALAKAISLNARYICVAPCCHKYVRQRLTSSSDLEPVLRHGILSERFADGLTDSLRVLTLESLGYSTKLFEFVSPEHTAKNTMITAVKTGQPRPEATQQMNELKSKFGLTDFYLDRKLRPAE
ncbi:MAG: class I SAM-dependent methyltransferase [bacterium]|jgi:hypothetical protein